jgi:hypothetical protein
MAPFRNSKIVMGLARNFLHYPARQARFRDIQGERNLPPHLLIETGKNRFLTLGDGAIRIVE